jgi:hypothetical protein
MGSRPARACSPEGWLHLPGSWQGGQDSETGGLSAATCAPGWVPDLPPNITEQIARFIPTAEGGYGTTWIAIGGDLFAFATCRFAPVGGYNDSPDYGLFGGARLFLQKPRFLRPSRPVSNVEDVPPRATDSLRSI